MYTTCCKSFVILTIASNNDKPLSIGPIKIHIYYWYAMTIILQETKGHLCERLSRSYKNVELFSSF